MTLRQISDQKIEGEQNSECHIYSSTVVILHELHNTETSPDFLKEGGHHIENAASSIAHRAFGGGGVFFGGGGAF